MLLKLRTLAFAACLGFIPAALAQPPAEGPAPDVQAEELELTPEEMAEIRAAFEAEITRRTGTILIPSANVTLTVPEGYYYLDGADARTVLEEAWGNPPDATITGMLFRADMSAVDETSWGVVITYEDTGYVSDEDASGIDYDMLMMAMRDGEDAENAMRRREGYPEIHLLGWAAEPRYDKGTHKLYWAKELTFSGEPVNTLNYDMRVMGRRGVLSLNFVASIDQLGEVEAAAPGILAIPAFDAGSRYEDYNSSTDKKADFGVAGLIGGAAVAAALAKNTGILAGLLGLLAKFWYVILAAVLAIGAFVRNLFGGKPEPKRKAGVADAPPQPGASGPTDSLLGPPPPPEPPLKL